ncbi:hypothetical protein V8F06_006570 [Rhypophila decipiens]
MRYYFIDPSCDNVGGKGYEFEDYFLEAQGCARLAIKRLQSDTDTDFARVLNIIYKTPKTDTAKYLTPMLYAHQQDLYEAEWLALGEKTIYKHVMAALNDFASGWERTKDRQKADVRIYSDDGSRYQYVPGDDKTVDTVNHMWMDGAWDAIPANILGFTTYYTMNYADRTPPRPDRFEKPTRAVIQLLPSAWTRMVSYDEPSSLAQLQQCIEIHAVDGWPRELHSNDWCNGLVTNTIAHEFMHTQAYGFDDGSNNDPKARVCHGGWAHVMGEIKDTVWHDAEAFTCLLMAAGGAELKPYGMTKGGFTIDRSWDQIPGDHDMKVDPLFPGYMPKCDIANPKNTAAAGTFVFYEDLTQ